MVHRKNQQGHDTLYTNFKDKLQVLGLTLNCKKYDVSKTKLESIGHEISGNVVRQLKVKLKQKKNSASLKQKNNLKVFFGFDWIL